MNRIQLHCFFGFCKMEVGLVMTKEKSNIQM
jgi:hypothetical protein